MTTEMRNGLRGRRGQCPRRGQILAPAPACVEQLKEWKAGRCSMKHLPGALPPREAGALPRRPGWWNMRVLRRGWRPQTLLAPAQPVGDRALGGQSQPLSPAHGLAFPPLTHILSLPKELSTLSTPSPRTTRDREVTRQLVLIKAACPRAQPPGPHFWCPAAPGSCRSL